MKYYTTHQGSKSKQVRPVFLPTFGNEKNNEQIHTNLVDPYLSSCPPSRLITDSSGFPRLATLILHLVK